MCQKPQTQLKPNYLALTSSNCVNNTRNGKQSRQNENIRLDLLRIQIVQYRLARKIHWQQVQQSVKNKK